MEAARAATHDDLARLGQLAALAVSEAKGRRGGPELVEAWLDVPPPDMAASLSRYLSEDGLGLWAGTIDTQVVGVAAGRGAEDGRGRLDLIYVEPEARGVGVGECLLDAVVEWLTALGATGLDAPALPGDRESKQFFESAGLVARLLTMHRPL